MENLSIKDEDKLKGFALSALDYVRQKVDYADVLIENISKVEAKLIELPHLYCKAKNPAYNLEWVQAIQTTNIVQVLELVAHSALPVKNSRGAHYRRDYPDTDNDNFIKSVVAKQVDGRCEVRFEPVKITSITPPKGRRPWPG